MIRLRLAVCGLFAAMALLAAPAFALVASELDEVGVRPPPNAVLPLEAELTDLDGRTIMLRDAIGGRAAIVVFADYRCPQLCSPILAVTAKALAETGLTPGVDFRLVVVGFNPRSDVSDARGMIDGQIGAASPVGRATAALRAPPDVVAGLTAAVGYHYVYDAEHERYAHPAVLLVVGGDGRLSRVLSGLAADADDLRLALVEAGHGGVGDLRDQIRLLCYGFDAQTGVYTSRVRELLAAAGGLTVLGVAIGLWRLSRSAAKGRAA